MKFLVTDTHREETSAKIVKLLKRFKKLIFNAIKSIRKTEKSRHYKKNRRFPCQGETPLSPIGIIFYSTYLYIIFNKSFHQYWKCCGKDNTRFSMFIWWKSTKKLSGYILSRCVRCKVCRKEFYKQTKQNVWTKWTRNFLFPSCGEINQKEW